MENFRETSANSIKIRFYNTPDDRIPQELIQILKEGDFINYDEQDLCRHDEKGIIHWGDIQTYLISPISWSNKSSLRFVNCLGLAASGKDKFGSPISFLTHQDTFLLYNNKELKERFYWDLYNQLIALKRQTEYTSLDAVIFWGNGFLKSRGAKNLRHLNHYYRNGLEITNKAVKDALGFEAYIAHGPKQTWGHNDAFFDIKNNTLILTETFGLEHSYRPFILSERENMKKIWQSG